MYQPEDPTNNNQNQQNQNKEGVLEEREGNLAGQQPTAILPAMSGNLIQPPMQPPTAPRQRTVWDYLEENLDRYNYAIVMPEIPTERFALTSFMLNMLHTMG